MERRDPWPASSLLDGHAEEFPLGDRERGGTVGTYLRRSDHGPCPSGATRRHVPELTTRWVPYRMLDSAGIPESMDRRTRNGTRSLHVATRSETRFGLDELHNRQSRGRWSHPLCRRLGAQFFGRLLLLPSRRHHEDQARLRKTQGTYDRIRGTGQAHRTPPRDEALLGSRFGTCRCHSSYRCRRSRARRVHTAFSWHHRLSIPVRTTSQVPPCARPRSALRRLPQLQGGGIRLGG